MGERSRLEALDVPWARSAPARVPAGADTTPAEREPELAGSTAP